MKASKEESGSFDFENVLKSVLAKTLKDQEAEEPPSKPTPWKQLAQKTMPPKSASPQPAKPTYRLQSDGSFYPKFPLPDWIRFGNRDAMYDHLKEMMDTVGSSTMK